MEGVVASDADLTPIDFVLHEKDMLNYDPET
jgi:hypothetical protein